MSPPPAQRERSKTLWRALKGRRGWQLLDVGFALASVRGQPRKTQISAPDVTMEPIRLTGGWEEDRPSFSRARPRCHREAVSRIGEVRHQRTHPFKILDGPLLRGFVRRHLFLSRLCEAIQVG